MFFFVDSYLLSTCIQWLVEVQSSLLNKLRKISSSSKNDTYRLQRYNVLRAPDEIIYARQ